MIIEMARIRVLGPRAALAATIRALQDEGVVHLIDAECPDGVSRPGDDPVALRRSRHLQRALADVDTAIAAFAKLGAVVDDATGPPPPEARAARFAARAAVAATALVQRDEQLARERDALRAYEPLFDDLERVLAAGKRVAIHLLRLSAASNLDSLRAALVRTIGPEHELRAHALTTGETVVLLLVPEARNDEIEHYLAGARVERAPLPAGLGMLPIAAALERMRPRLDEVERELSTVRTEAAALAKRDGDTLARSRRLFHDALIALEAADHAAQTTRAFVLEGWIPARERARLVASLARAVGPEIGVEQIARDDWHGDDAPVVLANPRLFAPFEALTAMLPLPRYGSVDPTPFVAVFFPMFFGVIVGDVGYGAVIAALAIVFRLTSKAGSPMRSVAKIAGAVSVYAIAFGFCYGELFGDLGSRIVGMHPLWFDRREAVFAFLALAIALGLVHLVLGLVVAAANRWRRHRREAIGRGLTAVLLVLVAIALLALLELVPAGFLTPAVLAILVTFPLIVILEGLSALLDLMSIVGHVLSYARVMALGTASVMLAIVANQMSGAFGSLALGIAFALIFHLVNFAITLFSPTIHVMRLHYVEFFGTFFEPGGGAYHPLRHWSPRATV